MSTNEELEARIEKLEERFNLHIIPSTGKPLRYEGDVESRIEKLEGKVFCRTNGS